MVHISDGSGSESMCHRNVNAPDSVGTEDEGECHNGIGVQLSQVLCARSSCDILVSIDIPLVA